MTTKDNLSIYEEERPWGTFRKFTENKVSTVKIITVNPNEELSLQSHSNREEFWHVIKGDGVFEVGEVKARLETGDEQYVPLKIKHKIIAGGEGIEILEISFGEFDEGDIVRYEDKYGRV
jgi:mannose-1-phosphate guanylyltransferase/mannose-1-phosphate guanylyltransferase/mannose-6-phosphate isomerase